MQALGIDNAAVLDGEHARGAPDAGPFDVILLNGSVPEVPESLLAQLKDGGRLVAVVAAGPQGRPRQGKATLFVKVDGEASGVPHFDANAKPLPGFAFSPSLHVLDVPAFRRRTVAVIPQCAGHLCGNRPRRLPLPLGCSMVEGQSGAGAIPLTAEALESDRRPEQAS